MTDTDSISDGYHTFGELYAYRAVLTAYAARDWLARGWDVVKSRRHHDGELPFEGGWFIIVAQTPAGPISFHYQDDLWDSFDVPEVPLAPVWDGHTSADALARLQAALRDT